MLKIGTILACVQRDWHAYMTIVIMTALTFVGWCKMQPDQCLACKFGNRCPGMAQALCGERDDCQSFQVAEDELCFYQTSTPGPGSSLSHMRELLLGPGNKDNMADKTINRKLTVIESKDAKREEKA